MAILLFAIAALPAVHTKKADALTVAQTTAYSIPGFDPDQWDGEFNNPLSVAVDSTGDVYVADYYNNRIQKFGNDGSFKLKLGSGYWDDTDGGFGQPQGVAISPDDSLYVADRGNRRIQKFGSNGTFISGWDTGTDVLDVAVDSSGNVYAVLGDGSNDRISKYSSSGTLLTTWGTSGNNDGQFHFWAGNGDGDIAVDASGNVYVSDFGNDRIQKFTSSGAFVTKWGSYGQADGEFRGANDIFVDSFGVVYVTDQYNDRIQKFDGDGNFISKLGTSGNGDGEFQNSLSGIAVSSSGDIFTAESSNRIQKFTSSGAFVTKWGDSGYVQPNHGPEQIISGPDGNLWTTLKNTSSVARTNPNDGSTSVFPLPESEQSGYLNWIVSAHGYLWVNGSQAGQYIRIGVDGAMDSFTWSSFNRKPVVTGDGSLWAVSSSGVAQINEDGTYTNYDSSELGNLSSGGVVGQDGNIWYASTFASSFRLVRFDVSSHAFATFDSVSSNPYWGSSTAPALVADDQGHLWFSKYYDNALTRFDIESENFIDYAAPIADGDEQAYPWGVTTGPDGSIYYCSSDRLTRFDPTTEVSSRLTDQRCLDTSKGTALIDGTLWLANRDGLLTIDSEGNISMLSNPEEVTCVTAGSDGHLWFSSYETGKIYRVEGSNDISVDYSIDKQLVNQGAIHSGDTVEYDFTVTNHNSDSLGTEEVFYIYDFVPTWLAFQSASYDENQVQGCASVRQEGDIGEEEVAGMLNYISPNHASSFSDLSYCAGLLPPHPGDSITIRGRFEATAEPITGQDNWAYLITDDIEDDSVAHPMVFDGGGLPEGFDLLDEWSHGTWQGYNNLARAVYSPGTLPNHRVLPNAATGSSVQLDTPDGTTINCSSSVKESDLSVEDSGYSYPLGLVDFCFATNQADNQVSLTFVTDLKPSQARARKYNPTTGTYSDISGAQVTETSYQGSHALKLTYNLKDNGELDLDYATGQIKDPVGLAIVSDNLADSGQNIHRTLEVVVTVIVLAIVSVSVQRRRRVYSTTGR